MSEELHYQNSNASRLLSQKEQELISFMVNITSYENSVKEKLSTYRVIEMKDGGMGSLKFISDSKNECKFGGCIAEAEFLDKDNVPVSVTINIDQNGELYELDIWKVDFSPLRQFPDIKDVKIVNTLGE